MNIKSVFSIFFIAFMLGGFFISAPAQSVSMPKVSMPKVSEQSSADLATDISTIKIEEDPVQERIIFEQDVIEDVRSLNEADTLDAIAPVIKPPRVDPYAMIEAARHPQGERRAFVSWQAVQQIRGRLNVAVIETKARLPEIKKGGLSPIEKLRDRFNQIRRTVRLKISTLLEHVGNRATNTAQRLRET